MDGWMRPPGRGARTHPRTQIKSKPTFVTFVEPLLTADFSAIAVREPSSQPTCPCPCSCHANVGVVFVVVDGGGGVVVGCFQQTRPPVPATAVHIHTHHAGEAQNTAKYSRGLSPSFRRGRRPACSTFVSC